MGEMKKARFSAGPLTFAVRHELWDGNIQDHPDQGIVILVMADVAGKETTLLRFNCFDFERSYVYGPENADVRVEGRAMLGGAATTNLYRMDSTVDGNPIGWTIRTLGTKLPKMLGHAGYPQIAEIIHMAAVTAVLPDVEACARELRATKRNTVKHNRGTHIFEAGNIRFGLEMRRLAMGDGGLAIHVLADIGGTPGKKYTEETELLAFDHFWNGAHYHYGPRNKNHRIYWDRTLVEDPLAWTLEQFEKGKLPAMIERAGYPGGGGSRRRKDRLGAPGDEGAGARYVGGRAAADRSSRAAAGADSKPRGRRLTPEVVERPARGALLGSVSSRR